MVWFRIVSVKLGACIPSRFVIDRVAVDLETGDVFVLIPKALTEKCGLAKILKDC